MNSYGFFVFEIEGKYTMNIMLNDFMKNQIEEEVLIGRVTMYSQNHYKIATENGIRDAKITGKMIREDVYPRVGDYVIYEVTADGSLCVIQKILDRQTCLSRKSAGTTSHEQVIAANMDYVFLVMALNDDFNIRRLERYLIGAWESGAEPVVILTKSDLCEDVDEKIQAVESVAFGIPIIPISALEGENVEALNAYNVKGKTIALVGSSGVGKSTLINVLAGKEIMKTDGLRDDDKGRHTTTHREMIFTEKGILIDTPGMREFSNADVTQGLSHEFADIIALMSSCKFKNCQHHSEPGCAVVHAINEGTLSRERLNNYYSLEKEAARQARKVRNQEAYKMKKAAKIKRKSKPRVKNWAVE